MAQPDQDAGLEFLRVFDAPPEVVFACFTEPGHLTHFWAPNGASAPSEQIRVDPRPGGRFETLIVTTLDKLARHLHQLAQGARHEQR